MPVRWRRPLEGAEAGHDRSRGPVVPAEEPGHWPGAACKVRRSRYGGGRYLAMTCTISRTLFE